MGMTMDEVLKLEGEPAQRSPNQLVYSIAEAKKVEHIWAYILLMGPLSMINRDYWCLTLNFENNILVSHSTTDRDEDESC